MFWRNKSIATPPTRKRKTVRNTILGMSAVGTLAAGTLIKPWEGRELCTYVDPVGIPTVCDGITDPKIAKKGMCYSNAQCDTFLAHEVNAHEKRLDQCLTAEMPLETKAAILSFAFNVGTGAACKSTLVRKANAGDLEGACNQLPRWVFAGGRVFNGLKNRRYRGDATRISERTLCRVGLDPAYKTPVLEKVMVQFRNWKTQWGET